VIVVLPFGCQKRAGAFKKRANCGTLHKTYWEVQGLGRLEILYALGAPESVLAAIREVESAIQSGLSTGTILQLEQDLWHVLVEELRK
jgi:hypothetical protein